MNILVFARAPELGRVKTRLEPALGAVRTLALYRAFLADTLEAARATGARVLLAHTRGDFEERDLADDAFEQRGESFGARFDAALGDAYARHGGPTVLVGADTPHLGSALLRDALDRLRTVDAVLGPSTEGGFYLLGFRGAPARVAGAFAESNEAAAVARLTAASLLPPSFDIDVPEDLGNLLLQCETREAAQEWVPPRTRAFLRAMRIRVDANVAHGARHRRLIVP